jgi:hypothetical protein
MGAPMIRFTISSLLLLLAGCANAEGETRSLPARVEATPDRVEIAGRWVTQQQLDVPLLGKANTADMVCRKKTMTCTEAIAVLMTAADNPQMEGQALFVVLSEYAVESWDESKIRAKSEKRVADVFVEIDLVSQSAVRQHRETKARGAQSADPDFAVEWQLR